MGERTLIQWTDHTFNPWIGCTKVSPGCANCYAEAQDHRWGHDRWGKGKQRGRTTEANWKKPIKWNRDAALAGKRARVFCASLADVFDPEVPAIWRGDLFALIESTPHLDWQLLTKRPEHFNDMAVPNGWPANVWLGTSVEDQDSAEKRIPLLMSQKAAVRFLSLEPLLGPVDLSTWLTAWAVMGKTRLEPAGRIHWAIVGGESGPNARSFHLENARDVVEQCRAGSVACFVKQLGSNPVASGRDQLALLKVTHRSGGDWDEWPVDLRVREFPGARP